LDFYWQGSDGLAAFEPSLLLRIVTTLGEHREEKEKDQVPSLTRGYYVATKYGSCHNPGKPAGGQVPRTAHEKEDVPELSDITQDKEA
jgi:hypothetical protein